MSAKISDLQERQIVNIADGRCLGNIKDIELNILDGSIQALVLPGMGGFWNLIQNQGELLIPWQKVVRLGVDVVLIDMPELTEHNGRANIRGRGRRRKEDAVWQQEVQQYQQELQQSNIIVLPPEQES